MVERLKRTWLRIKTLRRREQLDRDLEDEVAFHLAMREKQNRDAGFPAEEARYAARRQFGNVSHLQERSRDMWTFAWLETLWRDFTYALRALVKQPSFAAIAMVTLGLGIGASTAIFSVIDNVLLEPFPYKGAGRMVFPRILDTQGNQESGRQGYTATEFVEFAENNHVFDGITAASEDLVLYRQGEGTEQLYGVHVTPGTFEFFGMPALRGRVLEPADYEPGATPVFVLRYKTWMTRFNGDRSILNRTFELNGTARTLIGIMPPRFGWYDAEVFIPEKLTRGGTPGFAGFAGLPANWFLLGRLKPGVTTEQAAADLTVIANGLAKIYPQDYPAHFTVGVKKLGDTVVGRFEATLYTVLAAVGLLLLIACGNVANLMLARATAREKEFTLRAVLGAGRVRLVRMLLVESLVLAMGGAALGILIAWGGLKALLAAMPQDLIPAEAVIELNAPVLGFTLGVAMLTALLFGLVPALQAARRDLNDPLRDSGKGVSGGGFRSGRLRDAVVVMEVALSLTLLVGAGLLMRSFVALREVHLGFQADHVFQTQLPLPEDRYKTAKQVTGFFEPLLARLKALPGVMEAAESSALPPNGGEDSRIAIAGKTHQEDWHALFDYVSEGYFRVLRIELKEGRVLTETEIKEARKVAVVNETFVRKYLRGENPMGQPVRLERLETLADPVHDAWFEIVGVVADVTNQGLQVPIEPEVWVPYTVTGSAPQVLLVRTAQDPGAMMNAIRQEIWATDSGVALAYPSSLEDRISRLLYAGPRFGFLLMTIFGCIGLILVTVGVYSVLAYTTARKTHEIGIRMALGAKGADVLGLVVKAGLRLVLLGATIGLMISQVLGRLVAANLVGVKAGDPITLAATTILLMATGAVACWIPARRAARVDPMVALRYQ